MRGAAGDTMTSMRHLALHLGVAGLLVALAAAASGAAPPPLQPFASSGSAPLAPWRVLGLPHQHKPFTRFTVTTLDGHQALRVEADSSYGLLVHTLHENPVPRYLSWLWRVDELNPDVDLRRRSGEDSALKVCVLWDMAIDRVPFFERQILRVARATSDVPLPAASVCYVWDAHLPVGTQLDSPFTHRLRFIVLRSADDALHQWAAERRDIGADFQALFGHETSSLPALIGVAVGADADNTHGHSLGYAAQMVLE